MRKIKQTILIVLLAVSMMAVSCSVGLIPVTAEAATQEVVTLNTTELKDWPVGKTGTFYAYVNGRRVSNATLNWSSSNTAVATCENGLLTAVGAGTAVITCSKENAVAATCTVTVKGTDVVTLNTTSLTNWPVGKTGTFYTYVNGKRVANSTMTWCSNNTTVATCVNGVLTAKGPGTAIITCTRPNATTATCTITVKGNDEVTLNTTSLTNWPVGKSGSFYAYVNGKRVSNASMTWSSSNTAVATCVNGVLTAKGPGTATISCTRPNATTAMCTVTVKNDVVTLNATEFTNWPVGKTGTFYAYVNGKRVSNATLTWNSSNPEVATCENGVLTAKTPGTAIITCTRPNATTATCTVTVKQPTTAASKFRYEIKGDGTIRIKELADKTLSEVYIPTHIRGKQVTEIGDRAFSGCSELTKVILPEGLVLIGNNAFEECYSLEGIRIPGSVKKVGDMAFGGLNIKELILEDGLQEIGYCSFCLCLNLKQINIPGSVKIIGPQAFSLCQYVTDVQIGDGVQEIGSHAFYLNLRMTEAILPDSVECVGEGAFEWCQEITKIRIPNNNTTFGMDAFYQCSEQMVFEMDAHNEYFALVNGVLFSKDMKKLIHMPSGANPQYYRIPEGVEEICASAFAGNPIYGVTFPESLISIGERAFASAGLIEVYIPEGVEKIGVSAFEGTRAQKLIVDSNNRFYKTVDNILFDKDMKTLLYVPLSVYYDVYTIPDGVTTIAPRVFASNTIEHVVMPDSVVTIADEAFYESQIREIEMSNNVVTIGDWAFATSVFLTEFVVPDSVTTIGDYAFINCFSLETITIPANVTEIGESVFDEDITIITTRDSYADIYAQENGYNVQYQ